MSQIDRIDGGVNTARVSAADADRQHREQRQADALAYLTRTGNTDVAEALGLVPPPVPRTAQSARKPKPVRKPTSDTDSSASRRKGCPSEAQHRRHRERGETCAACSELTRRINADRKRRAKQRRAGAVG